MRPEQPITSASTLPPLDPLEIGSGVVLGPRRTSLPPTPNAGPPAPVRDVLVDLLRPQLEAPTCFVAFSGGRDSAALLSLAARIARERGLADPVPVTIRFPGVAGADESSWQERTIDHLGLSRWTILEIGDELDPLSPLAREILRRHGLFWPPVAQRIAPLVRAARGHTLVLGTGGDEMFSPWTRYRVRRRLRVRGRPLPQAVRRIVFNLLPEHVRARRLLLVRRDLRWLRPAAKREVVRKYEARLRKRSANWAEAIGRVSESRNFELTQAVFAALATDHDVALVQPFFDARFIRAIGASAPAKGFVSRAAATALHFEDVLPPGVAERPDKAVFDELHGGEASRAFAQSWDGSGLDPELVDPEALRREWLSPRPEYHSLTALNAAWLATAGGGS